MEAGHAADHGGIVSEAPIAMDFAELGKDLFHVIEEVGPLGMAGELCPDPGFAM